MSQSPILFFQHGMGESNQNMQILAGRVASENAYVVVPNLNLLTTFLNLDPLIEVVERSASETLNDFPQSTFSVVGFSMGGILWVEVYLEIHLG